MVACVHPRSRPLINNQDAVSKTPLRTGLFLGALSSPTTIMLPVLLRPLAAVSLLFASALASAAAERLEFNRDIRPILSENCFQCHGNDKGHRKGGLRLDVRAEALKPAKSDAVAIVPGDPEASELVIRILSEDPEEVMPPEDAHKKLTAQQKETLKRWVAEGAEYQEHWAFIAPQRPAAPKIGNAWWPKNPIDNFIAAKLEARQFPASPEAPKELLLRRATLDLTGLPPTPPEVRDFLADTAPDAYERAVDRLLASPRYGEHMAKYWLDAARYGDTHGLHLDNERSMWPYRDWVVRAFNENLTFDQFTIWQIAGDLLPKATRDQQIASGFNRCNVTSSEGGSIPEELLFRYAVDRTDTAATIWMGLTTGCAVCHDHKFDPISAKDFYSLYAFFSSAADPAMDGNDKFTAPVLKLSTPEQQAKLDEYSAKITATKDRIAQELTKVQYTDPATLDPAPPVEQKEEVWIDDEFPADVQAKAAGHALTWVTAAEGGQVKRGDRAIKRSGTGMTQDYFEQLKKPFLVPEKGKIFVHVWLDPMDPPKALMLQWHADGNWDRRANWGDKDVLTFGEAGKPSKLHIGDLPPLGEWARLEVDIAELKLKPGTKFDGLAFTQYGGTVYWDWSGVSYASNPASDISQSQLAWEAQEQGKFNDKLPKEIATIFREINPKDRKPEHNHKLRDHYLSSIYKGTRDIFDPIRADLKKLEDERKAFDQQIPATLVMRDLEKKRPAHIMVRGQYDKPGEKVTPAVPEIFPQLKTDAEANRLDLAQWLVAPEHPLTARVIANRYWQQFFGLGLVKTSSDFGVQGDAPSHPELLDWLAVEFRESGWDLKKFVRTLVTSATYRQDSRATPALLEADPENRLLARGPRFRLDAEAIRDSALFVSGLMNGTIGGVPVKPYQPGNVWEPVGFVGSNTRDYKQDTGDALYRRSLYTFWKRTAPPPSMTTFDAPSRESSCTRRERSNTPLQALLVMNDVQQFEAARALGQRMLTQGGVTPDDRLAYGFQLVTARQPLATERQVLKEAYEKQLAKFGANQEAARQAITYGESKPMAELNPAELAAYTLVGSLLLNLDETLTRN
jgi:hypothetical protein